MTLLIGANLKHYAIIAADTRTSWHHPFFGNGWNDQDHKIVMCSLGLITGSGYVGALNPVKKELIKTEIRHTDELLRIINELAIPEIKLLHKFNPAIKDNTCFLFTYRTNIDNEIIVRLSFLHPKWDYQLIHIEKSTIVMPIDTNENVVEKYSSLLHEGLKEPKNNYESDKEYAVDIFRNIYENAIFLANFFYDISGISNHVSRDFDVAALLINGTIIYGYGETKDVKLGKVGLSIMPGLNHSKILTPEIFKEGNIINL